MRRLFAYLSITLFVAVPSLTIISCANDKNNVNYVKTEFGPYEDEELNSVPVQQRELVRNTSFITKLILLSRHENLNFNLNEVLSIFLTPDAVAETFPMSYVYEDDYNRSHNINIARYIDPFLQMTPVDRQNNFSLDSSFGVFASYILGMYDDNVYQSFADNLWNKTDSKPVFTDSSDGKGNWSEPYGHQYGQNPNLKLSSDKDRQMLAWGIQDTGPLTNYLLTNGYNGGNPGGPWYVGVKDKRHTNFGSYLLNNGQLMRHKYISGDGSTSKIWDPNSKLRGNMSIKTSRYDSDFPALSLFKDNQNVLENYYKDEDVDFASDHFGTLQNFITKKASDVFIQSSVTKYATLVSNFAESETGASYILAFMNEMMPFMTARENQKISKSTILTLAAMHGFMDATYQLSKTQYGQNRYNFDTNKLKTWFDNWLKAIGNSQLLSASKSDNPDSNTVWRNIIDNLISPIDAQPITSLVDKDDRYDGIQAFVEALKYVASTFASEDDAKDFVFDIMGVDSKLTNQPWQWNRRLTAISIFMPSFYNSIFSQEFLSHINFFNIIRLLGANLQAYLEHIEVLREINDNYQQNYIDLTNDQKRSISLALGFNGRGFSSGSILAQMNRSVNDPTQVGYKDLKKLFFDRDSPFQTLVKKEMKIVHEYFLEYALRNDYWKFDINSILADGAVVGSVNQINSQISYTIDYVGKGDPSVTKYYERPNPELFKDFNPYQSGPDAKPLVKLDNDLDYIKYDGLGNIIDIQENPVHHRYEIMWRNVSNTNNQPYWVITKIRAFDMDNGGKEIFNLY